MPPRKKPEVKNLANALANLEKQFGSNAVVRMNDAPLSIEAIPTEIAGIDIALGRGGLPKGRITEIYGPESSGKTSLALRVIATAQKQGGNCAFIDAEHALDPEYAEALGVDTDNLFVAQPDDGETALEIADQLISSGEMSVVIIDSVAALTPRSEIEGEMGDANVGKQARMMSQALRKLSPVVSKTNTILIFINQLREKIGVLFGSPETTTGGKGLKFYASVRIDVRGTEALKDGDDQYGKKTYVKIVKNKVARPFKRAEVETYYGKGISRENSAIMEGVQFGIIEKSGQWYAYEDTKHQGKKAFQAYLEENPSVLDALYHQIMEVALPKPKATVEDAVSVVAEPEQPQEDDDLGSMSDDDSVFDQ